MSQGEILDLLKKEKLLTAKEIAEELGISEESVRSSLKRMLNYDVEIVEIKTKKFARKSFAWKIRV